MDQVRVALAWLKEHHFWVLSVLIVLVSVTCWYLASGHLQQEFSTNEAKITQQFNAQRSRKSRQFHPNPDVNSRTEEEIKQLAAKVRGVWTALYDEQRERVLRWPATLDAGVDVQQNPGDSFLRHVAGKAFGEFIATKFQERYGNYIKTRFPDLPELVKALEMDERNAGRAGGPLGAEARPGEFGAGGAGLDGEEFIEEQDFLVIWEDQNRLRQQLDMPAAPSSIRIWVTQEDLWVYETLLSAIAETNRRSGADRHRNAAVRNIYQMVVGAGAASGRRSADRLYRPEGDPAAGPAGEPGEVEPGLDDGRGGGEFGGGEFGGGEFGGGELGGGAGGAELQQLLNGRYIDEDGRPLPAPPNAIPGAAVQIGAAEFKRLPVRMGLRMDQRWLPRLIVELANASLKVVVDEVRINPTGDTTGGFGGGLDGGGRAGGGLRTRTPRALQRAGRGGFGARGGLGGFLPVGGAAGGGEVLAFPRESNVVDVVLTATVYIFNPPDPATLAIGDDGSFVSLRP